jgi:hypothetical protein
MNDTSHVEGSRLSKTSYARKPRFDQIFERRYWKLQVASSEERFLYEDKDAHLDTSKPWLTVVSSIVRWRQPWTHSQYSPHVPVRKACNVLAFWSTRSKSHPLPRPMDQGRPKTLHGAYLGPLSPPRVARLGVYPKPIPSASVSQNRTDSLDTASVNLCAVHAPADHPKPLVTYLCLSSEDRFASIPWPCFSTSVSRSIYSTRYHPRFKK